MLLTLVWISELVPDRRRLGFPVVRDWCVHDTAEYVLRSPGGFVMFGRVFFLILCLVCLFGPILLLAPGY